MSRVWGLWCAAFRREGPVAMLQQLRSRRVLADPGQALPRPYRDGPSGIHPLMKGIGRSLSLTVAFGVLAVSASAAVDVVGTWSGKISVDVKKLAEMTAGKGAPQGAAAEKAITDSLAKIHMTLTISAGGAFSMTAPEAPGRNRTVRGKWTLSGQVVTLAPDKLPGQTAADVQPVTLTLAPDGQTMSMTGPDEAGAVPGVVLTFTRIKAPMVAAVPLVHGQGGAVSPAPAAPARAASTTAFNPVGTWTGRMSFDFGKLRAASNAKGMPKGAEAEKTMNAVLNKISMRLEIGTDGAFTLSVPFSTAAPKTVKGKWKLSGRTLALVSKPRTRDERRREKASAPPGLAGRAFDGRQRG